MLRRVISHPVSDSSICVWGRSRTGRGDLTQPLHGALGYAPAFSIRALGWYLLVRTRVPSCLRTYVPTAMQLQCMHPRRTSHQCALIAHVPAAASSWAGRRYGGRVDTELYRHPGPASAPTDLGTLAAGPRSRCELPPATRPGTWLGCSYVLAWVFNRSSTCFSSDS
jgi:hypothetical protein